MNTWRAQKLGNDADQYSVYNVADGKDIAIVFGKDNAETIETVPELLEALQGCIDELELHEKMARQTGDTDLLQRLRAAQAALAKATKQPTI